MLNIKNNDEKCLLWCLLAALHPVKTHSIRVGSYREFENELDMSGITYPVSVHQLNKVEKQNNLAISVLGWEEDEGFYPLRIPESKGTQIHLLLLSNDHTQHYVLIKSLSGLLSNRTKHNSSMFYCPRCLHGFTKKEGLDNHIDGCLNFKIHVGIREIQKIHFLGVISGMLENLP